jgi:hypothetical protein
LSRRLDMSAAGAAPRPFARGPTDAGGDVGHIRAGRGSSLRKPAWRGVCDDSSVSRRGTAVAAVARSGCAGAAAPKCAVGGGGMGAAKCSMHWLTCEHNWLVSRRAGHGVHDGAVHSVHSGACARRGCAWCALKDCGGCAHQGCARGAHKGCAWFALQGCGWCANTRHVHEVQKGCA